MAAWRPNDSLGEEPWRIAVAPQAPAAANSMATRYSSRGTAARDPRPSQDWQLNQAPLEPPAPALARLVVKKQSDVETSADYKGQYRRWPGAVLFVLLICGAVAGITVGAQSAYQSRVTRAATYQQYVAGKHSISDGLSSGSDVSADGQVNNPKSYSSSSCEMPDYQSKDGKLYAISKNGTEVVLQIKGINWFGMETKLAIPFGLWENSNNGTTAYEIASFLSRHNFNAVRLPVSIENILDNNPPQSGVINLQSNRAINTTNFITSLQSIVQALAFRNIGVLISMHTLTNAKSGKTWYDDSLGVTQDDFLSAVKTIATNLCGSDYWNVMGLDLKNEPQITAWGTGSEDDFVVGCEKIAKVMHANCPQWLGFVEGIETSHKMTLDGTQITYYDWWGGGLQGAKTAKPTFTIENKLVWAPHYYTTAVSPQNYFYGDGTTTDFSTYVELSDETLLAHVKATMNDMFGYLVDEADSAVVLGEFGGLYSKDKHPKFTTKRTTDSTINVLVNNNYAGGFMWSLNPESAYQYNPASTEGTFTEGLLEDDWVTPNTEFIAAFEPMDSMPNLKKFPCFPT